MLWDAIRGYMQLATGVTEATTDRAKEVAQGLLTAVGLPSSNELAGQVTGMADEVLNAARVQRDSLVALVRTEVTTVIDSSGLAKTADVEALTSRLSQVAADVEALVSQLPGGSLTPAGIRTRRRAEAGQAPPEAFEEQAVASDLEQDDSGGSARAARTTGPRKAASARKAAPASQDKPAGTSRTRPAKKSAPADTRPAARKSASEKTAAKEGSTEPRKSAAAAKGTSARKTASARKSTSGESASARKSTPAKKSSAAKKSTAAPASEASQPADGAAPTAPEAQQTASGGSSNE